MYNKHIFIYMFYIHIYICIPKMFNVQKHVLYAKNNCFNYKNKKSHTKIFNFIYKKIIFIYKNVLYNKKMLGLYNKNG